MSSINFLMVYGNKVYRNVNHSVVRMNTDMAKYNIKIQSFEPVAKSTQAHNLFQSEKPNLRTFAHQRLNK